MFHRVRPIHTPASQDGSSPNPANLDSYLIVEKVIYMCICDASYPRKLAFSYLDELSKEFQRSYEGKIDTVTRPYAFMGFGESFGSFHELRLDTFISKTTRLYRDSRTLTQGAGPAAGPSSHLDQLNENLKDVTRIMTKNMEDLLWRGDSLDRKCYCLYRTDNQECPIFPHRCGQSLQSTGKQRGISTWRCCYGNGLLWEV